MFSHLDQRESLRQGPARAGSLPLREGKTGTGAGGKAGAELVSTGTVPQTMEESRQGPDTGAKLDQKSRSQEIHSGEAGLKSS